MQAVALVTGDEFLIPYNLSMDTKDVFNSFEKLHREWNKNENDAYFDDLYGIDFARIFGPSGICYNFNMADPDKVFNLNT
jgi:hypothetical protein